MNDLENQTAALEKRIVSLLSDYSNGKLGHAEFLRWLMDYGHQASAILVPPTASSVSENGDSTDVDYDCFKNIRQFANCQRVVDFCHKHNLVLDKSSFWWWLSDDRPGRLLGIEQSNGEAVIRGIPRITNGITQWVERDNGELILVHRDHWKKDRKPSSTPAKAKKPTDKPTKPVKRNLALEEFLL